MESLVLVVSRHVEHALDLIAIAIIAYAALETLVQIVRGRASGPRNAATWLQFARWLVAALTFELAADIVSTTAAPTWNDLGKLAAIAAIRTFLTFFLDRDVERAEVPA